MTQIAWIDQAKQPTANGETKLVLSTYTHTHTRKIASRWFGSVRWLCPSSPSFVVVVGHLQESFAFKVWLPFAWFAMKNFLFLFIYESRNSILPSLRHTLKFVYLHVPFSHNILFPFVQCLRAMTRHAMRPHTGLHSGMPCGPFASLRLKLLLFSLSLSLSPPHGLHVVTSHPSMVLVRKCT